MTSIFVVTQFGAGDSELDKGLVAVSLSLEGAVKRIVCICDECEECEVDPSDFDISEWNMETELLIRNIMYENGSWVDFHLV
jgi:hypothetical protein